MRHFSAISARNLPPGAVAAAILQLTVSRLTDPDLAKTLRQAANVRFALSIPDLAAPAFVAGLYDDHIHSVFQVEGKLLAAYALTIHDAHSPLIGQPASSLIASHGLLPVQHADASGKERPEGVIAFGDCITGIIALENMQRAYRATTLAAVAPGKLNASEAFDRVDAVRRLDEIAHLAWRSAAHLLGYGT